MSSGIEKLFRTYDGETFDTEENAKIHIKETVRKKLTDEFKHVFFDFEDEQNQNNLIQLVVDRLVESDYIKLRCIGHILDWVRFKGGN